MNDNTEGDVPVRDAYWTVRSIDYVHPGPPLETSIFDDPDKLQRDWEQALLWMRGDAKRSPTQEQAIIERAEELTAAATAYEVKQIPADKAQETSIVSERSHGRFWRVLASLLRPLMPAQR